MKNSVDQIKQAEIEAEIFLKYAMALSKASSSDDDTQKLLALDNNLKLWVYIKTLAGEARQAQEQNLAPAHGTRRCPQKARQVRYGDGF